MLANLRLWAGAGTLLSPSEPRADTVWNPHAPWSGTRANPRRHGDPLLGCGPSRDSAGGALGRQAPFTALRHRALSLPAASHAGPGAPGIPAGMSRGWLLEGPGVAAGPVRLPVALGCLAALRRRGRHRCPSCLLGACTGQGAEGPLSLESRGACRVPASLAEPWGADGKEGFTFTSLWGN